MLKGQGKEEQEHKVPKKTQVPLKNRQNLPTRWLHSFPGKGIVVGIRMLEEKAMFGINPALIAK
jgi:hypothetical protein